MHRTLGKKNIIIFLSFVTILLNLNAFGQVNKLLEKSEVKVKSINHKNTHKDNTDTAATFFLDTNANSQLKQVNCQSPNSNAYNNKYKLIATYIPQENEDIKYVNFNFNIFQDYEGNNNFQPGHNPSDKERLMNMLAWVNEIYAKQPWCETTQTANSDPPQGIVVNDLPHKYIQFKLNGIYEYRDKVPGEGLWKSNNSQQLLNRIAETDSNRLKQLNICFTEKYYLASLRQIVIIKQGQDYEHPEVIIKDKKGKDAQAYATVMDGKIKNIEIINAGFNYSDNTKILITGGAGKGATAKAIINSENGSIQKIEVTEGGNNYKFIRLEIKGGGGAGAMAYISKIKKGKIINIIVSQKGFSYYDDPQINIITDSKGTGALLKPILKGATGFTMIPSFFDTDMFINEKSLWNEGNPDGDYAAATNLAHELGHTFDLLHTYNSGAETNNTINADYMPDLFGYNFTGYDIINWGKNPCENPTDKVSNNLMGGNQTSQYTSPSQIGKMHRALHLYNVKKYTDCHCDTKKKWVINKVEFWDFPFKSYNPIVVKNGCSLTIACTLEMPDGCDIVVENGGSLIITETGLLTGGCGKAWNGNLIIRKGAQLSVVPGGKYILQDLSKLIIE